MQWKNGIRNKTAYRYTAESITQVSAFIYGAKESGKTLFLEFIVTTLNSIQGKQGKGQKAAFFIDFQATQCKDVGAWRKWLDNWFSTHSSALNKVKPVVCVDNLPENDAKFIEASVDFFDKNQVVFLLVLANSFLLDTIAGSPGAGAYQFLEVGEWGPSRIREFTKKFFAGTQVDPEAAYFFVRRSLENTDLPANPVVISLYLSVFPTLGDNLSSLSFLTLLEKLELIRLDSTESSSSYSLYNKREILMQFARKCYHSSELGLPREDAEKIIRDFFENLLLEVDIGKFLKILDESKLVCVTGDRVEFSYYVFYDFYLAKAFAKKIADPNQSLKSLEDCIANSEALSFLAGLLREDTEILRKIVEHVTALFPPLAPFSLPDLDKHISDIADAEDLDKPVDEVTTKHLESESDYENEDPEFERNKRAYGKLRQGLKQIKSAGNEVDKLRIEMAALRTFYNVFRNLENIPGAEKIRLLDVILDYHIQCNIHLVNFFQKVFNDARFNAVSAYVVTLAGQNFLATNIGNQSLKVAIERCASSTSNDLKKLLLLLLYSDLGLSEHVKRLEDFLGTTKSLAALELIYAKARSLLIAHEKDTIPATLVGLFKKSFERRQSYYAGKVDKSKFTKEYQDVMKLRRDFHWKSDALPVE